MIEVKFSEIGTNARVKEDRTYMFFIRLLNECESMFPVFQLFVFITISN